MMTNEFMRYLEYVANSPSELAAHTPNFDLTLKQIDGDKGNLCTTRRCNMLR
jgi:hypothetical protein